MGATGGVLSTVTAWVVAVETLPARSLAVTDTVASPVAGMAAEGTLTSQAPLAPTVVS